MAKAGVSKAFDLLRTLPRVQLNNIKPLPGTHRPRPSRRGNHRGAKCGHAKGGQTRMGTLPPLGVEGHSTPFYLKIPKEPYYKGHHVRRQYPPLSLLQLQRLIDLGRVDTSQPIDLTVLCNTSVISLDIHNRHYGINLTDEGVDIFQEKVNIEVQWASESTIAAIERNGGVITTKFYDLPCVEAMSNPLYFLRKGVPIPRCKLPPQDAVEYYSSAKNRGYLAKPEEIQEARLELAQKYGYQLPDLTQDPDKDMLLMRKDPRQIWYGLEPGWAINLRDKCVIKPKDPKLEEYYKS